LTCGLIAAVQQVLVGLCAGSFERNKRRNALQLFNLTLNYRCEHSHFRYVYPQSSSCPRFCIYFASLTFHGRQPSRSAWGRCRINLYSASPPKWHRFCRTRTPHPSRYLYHRHLCVCLGWRKLLYWRILRLSNWISRHLLYTWGILPNYILPRHWLQLMPWITILLSRWRSVPCRFPMCDWKRRVYHPYHNYGTINIRCPCGAYYAQHTWCHHIGKPRPANKHWQRSRNATNERRNDDGVAFSCSSSLCCLCYCSSFHSELNNPPQLRTCDIPYSSMIPCMAILASLQSFYRLLSWYLTDENHANPTTVRHQRFS